MDMNIAISVSTLTRQNSKIRGNPKKKGENNLSVGSTCVKIAAAMNKYTTIRMMLSLRLTEE